MDNMEHKILNWFEHLWPYVAGVFAVAGAILRFWWEDRKTTRKLIQNNMAVVLNEVKEIRKEIQEDAESNTEAHASIVKTMNEQHTNTIKKMLELHSK